MEQGDVRFDDLASPKAPQQTSVDLAMMHLRVTLTWPDCTLHFNPVDVFSLLFSFLNFILASELCANDTAL